MSNAIEDNDEILLFVKKTILEHCPVVENRFDVLDDYRTRPEMDFWIRDVEDKTVIEFFLGTVFSKARTEERIIVGHNVEFDDVKGVFNFLLQDHGTIDEDINHDKEIGFIFGINLTEESANGISCGNIGLKMSFNSAEQKAKFYSAFKTYCTRLDNKNVVIDSRLLSEIRSEFFESCNKEQMLSMFGIMTVEHLARITNQVFFEKCSKDEILAVLSKMDESKLREYLSNIDYKTLLGFINSRGAVRPKRKAIAIIADHKYSVFYDEDDKEIMRIGFPGSDCWWEFKSATPVVITKDMELYGLLMNFMSQNYDIPQEQTFVPKKTENELVWHSDCYCEPDNPISVERVGRLTIHIVEDVIILQCFNDWLDKHGYTDRERGVGFGCCGNGARLAINKKTGFNLGDDFIIMINNPLQDPKPERKVRKPKRAAKNNKNDGKQEKKVTFFNY